jgi:hypothetical protein
MQKNYALREEYAEEQRHTRRVCRRNMQEDNAGVFHASQDNPEDHAEYCIITHMASIYMQEYAYSSETRGYNYVFDRI